MDPGKMKDVLGMSDADRLEYFVKKSVKNDAVWGLRDGEGWCGMGTGEDGEALPFWPEEAFAVLMAEEDWAAGRPASIPLPELIESWLPDMERDGVLAAVFPVFDATPTGMSALAVSAADLRSLLLKECEQSGGA